MGAPLLHVLVLSTVAISNAAIGPIANLYVGNNLISPDGFERPAVLAGSSPGNLSAVGPVIRGSKGDKFEINVVNGLDHTGMLRTTSIHWHGFYQSGTAWADGTAGVTQCPIVPGQSFQYNFYDTNQTGTFWYHSHHSTQYCDGLRGPMVVYDPHDPHLSLYDYDDENTIITVSDWYHVLAPAAGAVPRPETTLINGVGRYAGGPSVPLSVISVLPNKRYRFRLINMACDPNYIFSIDGHNLTIIEADSINVRPYTVSSVQIFAGQRYSFILKTDQAIENYWIRANPNVGTVGFEGGVNSAILNYWGAPVANPNTTDHSATKPMIEARLTPLEDCAAPGLPKPGGADINLNMEIGFQPDDGLFTVNGASFKAPSLPILLQLLNGVPAKSLLPADSIYVLPPNKVIEISMPGGGAGNPHPIHLHGHVFDVIRTAGSSKYNYVDPPKRDVVSLGSEGDNVTIRFKTDNPGPWIMHCHIDWHLEAGLSVVFAEDSKTVSHMDPPGSWDKLCPKYEAFGPEFPTTTQA